MELWKFWCWEKVNGSFWYYDNCGFICFGKYEYVSIIYIGWFIDDSDERKLIFIIIFRFLNLEFFCKFNYDEVLGIDYDEYV